MNLSQRLQIELIGEHEAPYTVPHSTIGRDGKEVDLSFEHDPVDRNELRQEQRNRLKPTIANIEADLKGLLPPEQDEHPIDPETGAAVEVYGYEATFKQAIDAMTTAIEHYCRDKA